MFSLLKSLIDLIAGFIAGVFGLVITFVSSCFGLAITGLIVAAVVLVLLFHGF